MRAVFRSRAMSLHLSLHTASFSAPRCYSHCAPLPFSLYGIVTSHLCLHTGSLIAKFHHIRCLIACAWAPWRITVLWHYGGSPWHHGGSSRSYGGSPVVLWAHHDIDLSSQMPLSQNLGQTQVPAPQIYPRAWRWPNDVKKSVWCRF
jgi:hypothetical protein